MRRLLFWFALANGGINQVLKVAVGLLMVGMTGIVLAAVFFRYVLNSSLVWSEEAARYLTIWVIFLGISVAHQHDEHIRMTTLIDGLSPRIRPIARLLALVVELTILAVIMWYGWFLTARTFARSALTPSLQIPMGWVYLAVPVGVGLTALTSLQRVLQALFASFREPPRPDQVSVPSAGCSPSAEQQT